MRAARRSPRAGAAQRTVLAATRSGSNIIRLSRAGEGRVREFASTRCRLRKGILGWPQTYPVVAKHAFTFLFNQAEFGLGCRSMSPTLRKAAVEFRRYALKEKYLDGLTQTDMSKLTQGGQS